MSSIKSELRLRVFAGPNGSGKSTIIEAVRNHKVSEIPVDFGIYINADDLAKKLLKEELDFSTYSIETTLEEFVELCTSSGLISNSFTKNDFLKTFSLVNNRLNLLKSEFNERLAQIIADFLRKKLLLDRKKFSFETVFSHPSKIDIMKQAKDAGYKVYLYFVSTEAPEINKYRVKLRTQLGGHDVPDDKIEQRYYRSLDLMFEAAQAAYQAFFFDNSKDGEDFKLFAHFKNINGEKYWDPIDKSSVPNWFIEYYSNKV